MAFTVSPGAVPELEQVSVVRSSGENGGDVQGPAAGISCKPPLDDTGCQHVKKKMKLDECKEQTSGLSLSGNVTDDAGCRAYAVHSEQVAACDLESFDFEENDEQSLNSDRGVSDRKESSESMDTASLPTMGEDIANPSAGVDESTEKRVLIKPVNCCICNFDISALSDLVVSLVEKGNREILQHLIEVHGIDPLSVASRNGLWSVVKSLLDENIHPCQNPVLRSTDNNPLHYVCSAIKNGVEEIVKYLVFKYQLNPELENSYGETPLHLACSCGNLAIVKTLIEDCCVDPAISDFAENRPIYHAVSGGHLKIVKYLIEECSISLDQDSSVLCAAAASKGDNAMLKYLIDVCGEEFDIQDDCGKNCLHQAKRLDTIRYLVEECKMDPQCRDNSGETALHKVSRHTGYSLDVIKYYTQEHLIWTARDTKGAINEEDIGQLNVVSRRYINPHEQSYSNTPLHFAVQSGNIKNVKYFIEECHVDPECRGLNGETPLHRACSGTTVHMDTIKYLVEECHIDPECRDSNGKTPLHCAARLGNIVAVKYFVEDLQLDPLCTDNDGLTAFHHVTLGPPSINKISLVKYFVEERKIDCNHQNNLKQTALDMALMNASNTMIAVLSCHFDAKVNFELEAYQSQNRVFAAVWNGNIVTLKHLVFDCHLDINIRDQAGRTALNIALIKRDNAMINFLIRECSARVNPEFGDEHSRPLNLVCQAKYIDTFKYLLCSGQISSDRSMQLAVDDRCLGVVKYLIEEHKVAPAQHMLHRAIARGYLELVMYFLQKCGLSCDGTRSDGATALNIALSSKKRPIVDYLITEFSAKVNSTYRDYEKHDTLTTAVKHFSLKEVEYLVTQCGYKADSTALFSAVSCGKLRVVQFLTDQLDDPPSDSGLFCLLEATEKGHFDIVKYLMEVWKVDPNSEDVSGRTALNIALAKNSKDIVHYLSVECNAKANAEYVNHRFGRSALYHAFTFGYYDIAKQLVRDGASLACVDDGGRTLLHIACFSRDLKKVMLLSEFSALETCYQSLDRYGLSPIHSCAKRELLEIMKYLLQDCHLDSQCRDVSGLTPLHWAARLGHLNVVEFLVNECGASPLCEDYNNCNVLQTAVEYRQLQIVKFLVETCKLNPNSTEYIGPAPLNFALLSNDTPMIDYLVKDCNAKVNESKCTESMHSALVHGKLSILKYLVLECGVDPECKDTQGYTLLQRACNIGDLHSVQYLISHSVCKPNPVCVYVAVISGHIDVLKYLVEECDMDAVFRDANGHSFLHVAAARGHCEIINYLLAIEHIVIDPLCRGANGKTPVHLAADSGHLDIVRSIAQRCQSDLQNCVDNDGDTPVHIAVNSGHLNIVEYLTQICKLSAESQNYRSETPLHRAVLGSHLHIVEYLTQECKVDLNTRNYDGATPLNTAILLSRIEDNVFRKRPIWQVVHYLVMNCRAVVNPDYLDEAGLPALHTVILTNWYDLTIVERLIGECNANIGCLDRKKQNVLHKACSQGKSDLFEVLIDHLRKCDKVLSLINSQDVDGLTPLHCAAMSGNISILKKLTDLCKLFVEKECKDMTGKTPLHHAACGESLSIVCYLIEQCHFDPLSCDNEGYTPLHCAIRLKKLNFEIIKYLEEQTSPVEYHSLMCAASSVGNIQAIRYFAEKCPFEFKESCTNPLHVACKNGSLECVQYLVEKCNISLNSLDHEGKTCFDVAVSSGNVNVARYFTIRELKQFHVRQTMVHIACLNGNLELVKLLLKSSRESLALKDSQECTPFFLACANGHLYVVKHLVLAVKTVNKSIKKKLTIGDDLDSESLSHYIESKTMQSCADVDRMMKVLVTPDMHGSTPLHVACKNNFTEVVDFLLTVPEFKELLYAMDSERNTPLDVTKNIEVIDILCKNGVSLPEKSRKCLALHDACFLGLGQDAQRILADSASENILHSTNADGKTPIECAKNYEMMKLLVDKGASPDLSKYFEATAKPKVPHPDFPSSLKLYVIGNPLAGKSTLATALQCDYSIDTVDEVDKRTAGIVLSDFISDELGRVTIYDFAGHPEYYASHSAVLENSLSCPAAVFLMLIDLREPDQIQLNTNFWLSFVENNCKKSFVLQPHLVVIGTHFDECSSNIDFLSQVDKAVVDSKSVSANFSIKYIGSVALDCRKPGSESMVQLKTILIESSHILRSTPIDSFYSKLILVFLRDCFTGKLAVHLAMLIKIVSKTRFSSLHSTLKVYRICEQLNDSGYILFLPNTESFESSWIVMDKESLLSEINGTIFAPKGFSEHKCFSSETGVLTVDSVATLFPQFDSDLIIECLLHLEYCQLVNDGEVLNCLQSETAVERNAQPDCASMPQYLYFPSLVSIEKPSFAWQFQKEFNYHFAWYFHCTSRTQFLTARFLQVLLLRVMFHFATASPKDVEEEDQAISPVTHRQCSVWKSGIRWLDLNGIETIVEIVGQHKGVLVMMRCYSGSELDCVRLRSSVVLKVRQTQEQFCPKLTMKESFVDPSEIQEYPLKVACDLKRYDFSLVNQAVLDRKRCVYDRKRVKFQQLGNLFFYEPYLNLGKEIVTKLHDPANAATEIPSSVLLEIANNIESSPEQLRRVFDLSQLQLDSIKEEYPNNPTQVRLHLLDQGLQFNNRKNTFGDLKEVFGAYSIYQGRNP